MPSYPTGPESGVVYTIESAEGYQAVLNDPTSPNYAGMLVGEEAVTGLEGAEVRENITDLVEADGGSQGPNWAKPRTFTLKPTVWAATPAARNAMLTRLQRASNAMRSDLTVKFTPSGSIPQFLTARRAQRPVVTGAFAKQMFLAFTAADPRIYSQAQYASAPILTGTPGSLENQGTAEAWPTLRINGPGTNPTVTGHGVSLSLTTTLTAGQYVDIVTKPGSRSITKSDGSDLYSSLNFLSSAWWGLLPGINSVSIAWASGNTAASTLVVTWRDTWL